MANDRDMGVVIIVCGAGGVKPMHVAQQM